jgi:hypothetical protein
MSTSSVKVAVSVFTPDPTPGWAEWLDLFMPAGVGPAVISPGADPDKDGSDNFSEYAFASDPLNGTSRPALAPAAGPAGCQAFTIKIRRDAMVTFTVDCSSDLLSWTPWRFRCSTAAGGQWEPLTPGLNILAVQSAGEGVDVLTLCIPSSTGTDRCFGRATATGN